MLSRREFLNEAAVAAIVATTAIEFGEPTDAIWTSQAVAMRPQVARHKSRVHIKSLVRREETVLRYGGHGDNWHMTWAADDRQYVSLCDGSGFTDPPLASYNSRMLAISGGPLGAKFHDLPTYPMLGQPTQKSSDARYYGFGTLALDRVIYQFMSTFNRSSEPGELSRPDDPLRFNGVKLIYSPDNGQTWHNQNGSTPVVWESWGCRSRETMVFFEEDQEAFSLLSVLQMGKNYEYNLDGYVYVYAPNGNADGTMNELVMFRVRKDKLLDRSSFEFFAGRRSDGGARWTRDITARAIVHTFPRGWVNKLVHPYAWQPSVVYNAPLRVYMMANWGMGVGEGVDTFSGAIEADLWFTKPSYLGFWIAPNPWGPWTQAYEELAWMPERDVDARAYQPQIAPKWIAADGRSFWLVWTDFQVTDKNAMRRLMEDRHVSSAGDAVREADMIRTVRVMREYMPYYSFNMQRIDLDIA